MVAELLGGGQQFRKPGLVFLSSFGIDGDFLRVLPEKTAETVIVTVLHPRKITRAASKITKVSLEDSVVDLTIKYDRQIKKVKLDLAKQEVSL